MPIFVRHGQPHVNPDVDSSEWNLDGDAVVAVLSMTGLHCADIDLSAGMVAR